MTRRSRSVTETATSEAQKTAATAASAVSPKARTQAPMSSAVTSSTSGYFHGIPVPQFRQRPRRTAHETIGMLSYHAIGASHSMHADPGCTMDRRTGTRAATTLRKLPKASPGTNTIAASAALTSSLLSVRRVRPLRGVTAQRHLRACCVSEDDVVLELVSLPCV